MGKTKGTGKENEKGQNTFTGCDDLQWLSKVLVY